MHNYEQRLTADEIEDFRKRCPRLFPVYEREKAAYCCIQIVCRGMEVAIPFLGKVAFGDIVQHCVAVRISCDKTREVWEVTPTEPTPPAKRLTESVTKHEGWGYMMPVGNGYMSNPQPPFNRARRLDNKPSRVIAEKCWECSNDDASDNTNPPDCAQLSDKFVKAVWERPYEALGDNCNAFAGWVETSYIGSTRLRDMGVPYWGGCEYQPK